VAIQLSGEEIEYRTTKCGRYGHAEISFRCDRAIPKIEAEHLIAFLEESVAEGATYDFGANVVFGFSILYVGGSDERRLREPDFQSIPIAFVDALTRTFQIQIEQRRVAEVCSPELKPDPPKLINGAFVCSDFWDAKGAVIFRQPPTGNFSGWCCGCTNKNHDHVNRDNIKEATIYEIAVRKPELIKFLGLPTGVRVSIGSDEAVFTYEGKRRPVAMSEL
jgi:hypothetical protein